MICKKILCKSTEKYLITQCNKKMT